MAAIGAIEGFRVFTDQRGFNFKNLPNSSISFVTASAAGATASLKSTITRMNQNPVTEEEAEQFKKGESKEDSLRRVMYLSCWGPI